MPIELKMPALSPAMEEGTLPGWLVNVGDHVVAGDILAEIETDLAVQWQAMRESTKRKKMLTDQLDN